ncbi:NADH dehydrogenase ubiquinone 1 beta subcomplex subunit 2 [Porphyridium purpureum]|uniref:NADH dehydrogenase ubiquinone 1 beta subcomplex subunit 2 n=1 Tax=Porphyridium purpureum TaxID=35688 RepID=A0A5J4YJH5_PORPP|nr:NADH dehydrogenase ubiquinone 1 beta subcomplex subunit 2 [Porphyridium purpureum]|eukprot:POR5001..scf210_14
MGGGYKRMDMTKPFNNVGADMAQPSRRLVLLGRALGTLGWFWIFYRVKEDFPVVLGWRHPWDSPYRPRDPHH